MHNREVWSRYLLLPAYSTLLLCSQVTKRDHVTLLMRSYNTRYAHFCVSEKNVFFLHFSLAHDHIVWPLRVLSIFKIMIIIDPMPYDVRINESVIKLSINLRNVDTKVNTCLSSLPYPLPLLSSSKTLNFLQVKLWTFKYCSRMKLIRFSCFDFSLLNSVLFSLLMPWADDLWFGLKLCYGSFDWCC